MIELKMMTGKAALRLAKEESGLTQGEIADRLGVSHAVTKRYFNINDAYMPSLEMIPRLCVALGNDILVRWLEARLQGGEKFSREEIEDEMVRAANAFEELRALVNGEGASPSVRDM
ncbi:helix-turn-helix transcriptional regulator [uncultured Bilophila sp.]|nr:helix-turn-helix transcriptional regulator [uncultured Bilophila sp.]